MEYCGGAFLSDEIVVGDGDGETVTAAARLGENCRRTVSGGLRFRLPQTGAALVDVAGFAVQQQGKGGVEMRIGIDQRGQGTVAAGVSLAGPREGFRPSKMPPAQSADNANAGSREVFVAFIVRPCLAFEANLLRKSPAGSKSPGGAKMPYQAG